MKKTGIPCEIFSIARGKARAISRTRFKLSLSISVILALRPSLFQQGPAIFLERDRIKPMLFLEDPRGQAVAVVPRQDTDLGLGDNVARIELTGDEMDRASAIFVA